MKNIRIVDKGERPQFMDWDLYTYSSDVTTYNLYEQDWADLEAEGLTYLFEDRDDFERRKKERRG